jgi:hypothetical protein
MTKEQAVALAEHQSIINQINGLHEQFTPVFNVLENYRAELNYVHKRPKSKLTVDSDSSDDESDSVNK